MSADQAHPGRIGPYRLLEALGEGGMGLVYLAEQREPVTRRVALKLIKRGMDSKEVLARFQLERQALSMMEHANIARVFDAGSTEGGQPWFAMELVRGYPITDYCDERKLTLDERLELFLQVCDAIQHAHQKGVLHRDLKPSNVLVQELDGRAVAKVIDFGLAKAVDHRLTEATLFTQQGQILGTPTYMSPEQADMRGADIDTRSDIYSLSVLLYELLTGELPFRQEELSSAGFLGMVKLIRETQPPKPSTRVSTTSVDADVVASRRGVDRSTLRRKLRGDLDWIVMRGLEKDRNRRYQSAGELAADVRRHLDCEPVSAGPPSALYRFGRLARRNRVAVSLLFVALGALAAGTVGVLSFAWEASAQARIAEQREADFDQLAGVVHLETSKEREGALYPPWPSMIAAMRAWLADDAARLSAMRPAVERTIAELDAAGELSTSRAFLRETLATLRSDLEAFEREELADVRDRLAWAEQLEELGDAHPNARASWRQVQEELGLAPQVGLVPIGKNPASGLWEFYDLRSAREPGARAAALEIPAHDERGQLAIGDDSGLVFVLVHSGSFEMGATPRVDGAAADAAEPDEGPRHRVALERFLISRYEMTQGQWKRLSGGATPSLYRVASSFEGIGEVTWSHPVESVSWLEANALLRQHGMDLPTEAQWEYACRAGTTTPWWTGAEPASLEGAVNILDRTARRLYPQWGEASVDFDDGLAGPARVGRFRANPFGLHDLHGNLMEWCRDDYGGYDGAARAGDGLRVVADVDGTKVIRDGSHQMSAYLARSSARDRNTPEVRFPLLGVRPVRAIPPAGAR